MASVRALVGVALASVAVTAAVMSTTNGEPEVAVTAAAEKRQCLMVDVGPDSGRVELRFVQPSTQNSDRNDYHLVATLLWNNQWALDCYDDGLVDWAYEHELLYARWFDRKLWNVSFGGIPDEAGPYLDTTAKDRRGVTSLSFGIFRPEKLQAGVDYRVEFDLFLPDDPPSDVHPLTLGGEVVEKNCNEVDPWCVGLPGSVRRSTPTLVGEKRGFASTGDCWSWVRGSDPTRCAAPAPPPTEPVATTVPAPFQPPTTVATTRPPPTTRPTTTSLPPAVAPTTTTSPPTTNAPPPPPPTIPTPVERVGRVNGCNTYGQYCEDNPIYRDVPPAGYDFRSWPKIAVVANGAELSARCWARGGVTWNYAALRNPPDPGPNPYESDVYFSVRAPDGRWGWIPDTYFVRDKTNRMDLPAC